MKRKALIGPVILLLIWLFVTRLNLVDTFFVPDPFKVISILIDLLLNGSLLRDLGSTISRVVISFIIAIGIGLPLGLTLGITEKNYRSVEVLIDFFRSTPSMALFPLFLLIFGISDISKIALSAFSAMLIVLFNTAYGVMHARKSRILAVRIMGASQMQLFTKVVFWESLPQIFIGLRHAISISLVVIVATEMFIGTTVGLGRRIIDSQLIYEVPTMYAVIILTGVLGYILNLIFLSAERKFLHWSGR